MHGRLSSSRPSHIDSVAAHFKFNPWAVTDCGWVGKARRLRAAAEFYAVYISSRGYTCICVCRFSGFSTVESLHRVAILVYININNKIMCV